MEGHSGQARPVHPTIPYDGGLSWGSRRWKSNTEWPSAVSVPANMRISGISCVPFSPPFPSLTPDLWFICFSRRKGRAHCKFPSPSAALTGEQLEQLGSTQPRAL